MSDNYVYTAVFEADEEGGVNISFPMFEGAYVYAEKGANPISEAQEILASFIEDYESVGKELPAQSIIPEVSENQKLVAINVWMPYFRSRTQVVYIKKTLTIPTWLDILAKEKNINYSATLVKGLKRELGLPD